MYILVILYVDWIRISPLLLPRWFYILDNDKYNLSPRNIDIRGC